MAASGPRSLHRAVKQVFYVGFTALTPAFDFCSERAASTTASLFSLRPLTRAAAKVMRRVMEMKLNIKRFLEHVGLNT